MWFRKWGESASEDEDEPSETVDGQMQQLGKNSFRIVWSDGTEDTYRSEQEIRRALEAQEFFALDLNPPACVSFVEAPLVGILYYNFIARIGFQQARFKIAVPHLLHLCAKVNVCIFKEKTPLRAETAVRDLQAALEAEGLTEAKAREIADKDAPGDTFANLVHRLLAWLDTTQSRTHGNASFVAVQ